MKVAAQIIDRELVHKLGGKVIKYATLPDAYTMFSQYCYTRASNYNLNLTGEYYNVGYDISYIDMIFIQL